METTKLMTLSSRLCLQKTVSEIAFKSSDYLTVLDNDALQNDLDKAGYLETTLNEITN